MTRNQKEDLAIKYFSLYKRRYIHFNITTLINELLFILVCVGFFIEFTSTADRAYTFVMLVLSLIYVLLSLRVKYLCYSNVKDCINDG